MKTPNSNGFSLIGIMLIVLAITATGGLGVYVYNSRPKETIPVSTSSNNDNEVVEKYKEEVVEDTTSGFLVISQLGIKIPLSGVSRSDIVYTIGTVQGKNYAVAYVSSKSLKATLIEEYKEFYSSYPDNSANFGTVNLVLVPSANFDSDGRTGYPGDGWELDKTNCVTLGDNELCVIGNFVDLGKDYSDFVESVNTASKNASKL